MVTQRLKKQLEHEGYRIVGTHSAVKQCRWAKNALRGRGFCYKNTFYGIRSHQCMEFSCSIACANRCVFCWRHNNNPVSTTWRWEIDDPFTVVQHALDANDKLVIPFKGNNLVTPVCFHLLIIVFVTHIFFVVAKFINHIPFVGHKLSYILQSSIIYYRDLNHCSLEFVIS